MRFDEYTEIIKKCEIREECRERILDEAMRRRVAADMMKSSGMIVVDEPTEIVKSSGRISRRAVTAASVAALIGAAGIGFSVSGGNYEAPVSTETASMPTLSDVPSENVEARVISFSATGAAVQITDHNIEPLLYGEKYHLERYENNEWTAVEPIVSERYFYSIGLRPDENGHLRIDYNWEHDYGFLDEGSYRIVIEMDECDDITADFELRYYNIADDPYALFDEENGWHHPVNSHGETYGTLASEIIGKVPDLISVEGDKGIRGFVRKDDLFGEAPESPEDALKLMDERKKHGNKPKIINVYDCEGENIIDTFSIG